MSAGSEARPLDDSWVVALHSSEHDVHPSGSGLVLDRQRILTCAHVVRSIEDSGCEIWVAFPKAKKGPVPRSRVAAEHVVFADSGAEVQDLAVLHLSESVPSGVDPVPLRDPASASLLARRWWAFGFPQGHPAGNAAQGTVGEVLANDLLRMDRKSRYGIESGFSGAGVWSPDYRAVVAVVTEAETRRGDGQAIPLHYLEACFPGGQIVDLTGRWSAVEAGDVALSAWGWSLAGDREAERHWSPRARGVTSDSECGYRFQGRITALQVIKDWLDRDRDRDHRRMLVVTGAPGAGKSAVLGRIVTTADADAVRELPSSDAAVRATVGSVACAVHAKGKTALEVATEIARAASAELPDDVKDLPRVLHAAFARQGRRFNVIIDALDEAVSLSEARNIIRKVILPMTETISDVDVRVVAGSRRAGSTGDLLRRYRDASRLVDLDSPEFYAQEDLTAYALATLQLAGRPQSENERDEEGKSNPYADDRIAGPVAARIAELADGNFLVAGLTARTRAMSDETPISPEQLWFSPRISDVMEDYLELIPEVAGIGAGELLGALAFAESPGLPVNLWRKAIQALGYGNVTEVQLVQFTRTRAAGFLVESFDENGSSTVFRLFHQALNDALLDIDNCGIGRRTGEYAISRAFLDIGRDAGWERAPAYLLRSLPGHAARAGLLEDLLADDDYLLHADVRRIMQVSNRAVSQGALDRTQLLGHTPEAAAAGRSDRISMFSVTEALDDLGTAYRRDPRSAPYRARWASAQPGRERLVLDTGRSGVTALCEVQAGDRILLAVGDQSGGLVQLFDPMDGTMIRSLKSDQTGQTELTQVSAVCTVQVQGKILLAVSYGGMNSGDFIHGKPSEHAGWVELWDPADGTLVRSLGTGRQELRTVCALQIGDRVVLAASGYEGGLVHLWDPVDGTIVGSLNTGQDRMGAVCSVRAGERTLLAVSCGTLSNSSKVSKDVGMVQLWDPIGRTMIRSIDTGHRWAWAMCEVHAEGRILLAAGDTYYGKVELWDPADGTAVRSLNINQSGQTWVKSLCAVHTRDEVMLAVGYGETARRRGWVQLWNPADGTVIATLDTVQSDVSSVCEVAARGRSQLAVGCESDGKVRLWGAGAALSNEGVHPSQGRAWAVCEVKAGGRVLLAAGRDGGIVQLLDPGDGTTIRTLDTGQDAVRAVCEVEAGDRILLATSGYGSNGSGLIHLWDPADGTLVRSLDAHAGQVETMCEVWAEHRTLLAAAGSYNGGRVQLWDPADGTMVGILDAREAWSGDSVWAVCQVRAGERALLAVTFGKFGKGCSLQLWDPVDGILVDMLWTRHEAPGAMCEVKVGGQPLLAVAGFGPVELHDPVSGHVVRTLGSEQDQVETVCEMEIGQRVLLALGYNRGTVELWDPEDGTCALTVPVHHSAWTAAQVANSLAVGLTTGVIVIEFDQNMSGNGRSLCG